MSISPSHQQAQWIKTDRGWQVLVTFVRHWEAPNVGTGLGRTLPVEMSRQGTHGSEVVEVQLTSRVFGATDRHGRSVLRAFAERADAGEASAYV